MSPSFNEAMLLLADVKAPAQRELDLDIRMVVTAFADPVWSAGRSGLGVVAIEASADPVWSAGRIGLQVAAVEASSDPVWSAGRTGLKVVALETSVAGA